MDSPPPPPSAIAEKPALQFVIGPLRFAVDAEQIIISRADDSVRHQLLLRVQESLGCIEAAIISSAQDGSSERVIGRTPLVNLNRVVEVISAPMRAAAAQSHPVSAEGLAENGYHIVYIEQEYWQELLARAMGQSGVPDFSASFLEGLAPEWTEKFLDSLYKPALLDLLVEQGETAQPLIAVQDFADQSTMMWLRWNPTSESWLAFPFIPVGVPLLEREKMRELVIGEARKAPRFMYFLREFVQALQLEEWIDSDKLNEVYDASTGSFGSNSSLDAIAFDYHINVYETEHHHSLIKLVNDIATRSLSDPKTTSHLGILQTKHTEFSIRSLVERTEIALSRFKRKISEFLKNGSDQDLYKRAVSKNTRDPKQCLEVFKAVGVSLDLVGPPANLWAA